MGKWSSIVFILTINAGLTYILSLLQSNMANVRRNQAIHIPISSYEKTVDPIRSTHANFLSVLSTQSSQVISISQSQFSPRVQRIKDMVTQRQILLDISSCEFALRIDLKTANRTIDFSKLITKLDKNLDILHERPSIRNITELTDRIGKTKEDLKLIQQGFQPRNVNVSQSVATSTTDRTKSDKLNRIQELRKNLPILVREDGTVDWDGALSTSKEVARFGAELWERLNGKEEGIPSVSELFGQIQARELNTPSISAIKEKLTAINSCLQQVIRSRDDLKTSFRQSRKEGRSVDESSADMLFRLNLRVRELNKLVDLLTLDLDLERICVYLEQEMESSIDPNEQRQFVAEAALIDKQFASLFAGVAKGSSNILAELSEAYTNTASDPISYSDELISFIDDDELGLLIGEVGDLKSRLGIDTQSAFDWGSLGVLVSENVNKIKTGLIFFGDGMKLLVRDFQYLWFLFLKAAGGDILKPREVNAIRRTGKDVLTLIPFTIILIVPLTPVGHVLAFSFIQKYFPDFFPSFFTEKRQNLKKLFSEIERKNDDDLDAILSQDDSNDTVKNLIGFFNSLVKGTSLPIDSTK